MTRRSRAGRTENFGHLPRRNSPNSRSHDQNSEICLHNARLERWRFFVNLQCGPPPTRLKWPRDHAEHSMSNNERRLLVVPFQTANHGSEAAQFMRGLRPSGLLLFRVGVIGKLPYSLDLIVEPGVD